MSRPPIPTPQVPATPADEAAMLAGLIRAPSANSPNRNPDGAVTMIAVGQMNNLVDLLASPAWQKRKTKRTGKVW